MGVKVSVAAPLRQYCDKQKEVELDGDSVKTVLSAMSSKYPSLYSKICEEDGSLRKYVNLFVNGTDIKKQSNLDTPLKDSDKVTMIPAVAGGQSIY